MKGLQSITEKFDTGRLVIVIPTRNRAAELKCLVKDLLLLDISASFIIVDSSDFPLRKSDLNLDNSIVIYSRLKSAAHQRNLALRQIYENTIYRDCKYVLFLDDDVRLKSDFATKLLIELTLDEDVVGISPLVNHGEIKPSVIERLFPGKVLPGAVNVSASGARHDSRIAWLIGCSLWRLDTLREHLHYFEGDFLGQSVFEDVIFSTRIRKTGGKLALSNVPLRHDISSSGRPDPRKGMSEWTMNRYRYVESFNCLMATFLLANLLMCLRQIFGFSKRDRRQSLQGVIIGTRRLFMSL